MKYASGLLQRTARRFGPKESQAVDTFHRLYYNSYVWDRTYWLGVSTLKCPLDLWVYQEIVTELKPDVIVETGTAAGGSALFLASVCDLLQTGRIVTVDIEARDGRPAHDRIIYLHGSSTSRGIVAEVERSVEGASTVVVLLDSDHSCEHVLTELTLYSRFVTPGSYLIVEDTNISGHPVLEGSPAGPMEAVDAFLARNKEFIKDADREKFFLTFNPRGYLRKVGEPRSSQATARR